MPSFGERWELHEISESDRPIGRNLCLQDRARVSASNTMYSSIVLGRMDGVVASACSMMRGISVNLIISCMNILTAISLAAFITQGIPPPADDAL